VKKIIYLCLATVLFGGGYYLEYVYSTVSHLDRSACEAAYREQMKNRPEILEAFLDQCRDTATLIAMKANGGQLGAKEAAQQISEANRADLIRTLIAFGMIGAGIGAIGASFTGKKKTAT
jgi:hypothetical protein